MLPPKNLDPFGRPVEDIGIGMLDDGTLNIITPEELELARFIRDADEAEDGEASDAKVSKAEAHYRAGNENECCGICTMFRPPFGCTAVEGEIRAHDLCDLFEAK
jgi:hypothetical protein